MVKKDDDKPASMVKFSKESLRRGRRLLTDNTLVCAVKACPPHIFEVIFDEPGQGLVKVLVDDVVSAAGFHCQACGGRRNGCPHAAAAAEWIGRFHRDGGPAEKDGLEFQGLTRRPLDELIDEGGGSPTARLRIDTRYDFPHAPSKWARFQLEAGIQVGDRNYIGNLGNIRQLHFDKRLAANLKLRDFSLRDRQIIRFLAINAEQDGRGLTLDSEQTSELFHCLIGFRRFQLNGRRINIRPEHAEAVLEYDDPGDGGIQFSPAVTIGGVVMPRRVPRVISGRNGCWIGLDGDYWWLPATMDVSWLRALLRSVGGGFYAAAEFTGRFGALAGLPIRIVPRGRGAKPKTPVSVPVYRGRIDGDGAIRLAVGFSYGTIELPSDGPRLFRLNDEFNLRDTEFESAIIMELELFGFRESGDSLYPLELRHPEAVGIFLDKVVPGWHQSGRRFLLDGGLAKCSNGGGGLPEAGVAMRMRKECGDGFEIEMEPFPAMVKISWPDLVDAVRGRRSWVRGGGGVAKIGAALTGFVDTVSEMAEMDDDSALIRVKRHSMPGLLRAASMLPGAIDPAFGGLLGIIDQNHRCGQSRTGDFKLNGRLRDYQTRAVEWMSIMLGHGFNVLLADEMGLGKTLQTLAAMVSIRHHGDPAALVVCPTSLVENWVMECRKFYPEIKVAAVMGSNRREVWTRRGELDLLVASYAVAKRDLAQFKNYSFSLLILDEAQHIKNPSTANAKTCKAINAAHRLVLTGTPVENRRGEIWSMFDFLHPGLLGTYNDFRRRYGDSDDSADQRLARRVAPFIMRRRKADVCAELPEKQEQTIFCGMDAEQRSMYDELLENCRRHFRQLKADGTKKIKFEILSTLTRLRQVCCHPGILPDAWRKDGVPSAKTDLLEELLQESIDSGHRILVFSQFTSMLAIISERLNAQDIAFEYLDGATKNRQERVDRFNRNPDIPVFLLSLKAGGHGLNLTGADTVIIYDPWWNPAVEAQATDRTHRIGQTKPVTSIKLMVSNTVEERILALQADKRRIFDEILDNPKVSLSHLNEDDLEFLLG